MRHVRTFEDNNTIKVGDYVVCQDKAFDLDNKQLQSFLLSNIGVVIDINGYSTLFKFYVEYENIPDKIKYKFYNNVRTFAIEEIRLATAEEIEQYKLKQNIDRYNI
jgi:hypothetical protein